MSYPLEKRELIAEAPGLRMQILTLAAGWAVAPAPASALSTGVALGVS